MVLQALYSGFAQHVAPSSGVSPHSRPLGTVSADRQGGLLHGLARPCAQDLRSRSRRRSMCCRATAGGTTLRGGDVGELAALVRATPGLRLELLTALKVLRGKPLVDLLGAGAVCVEIAMLEGVGGVGNLLAQAPPGRVLFGSHAPLFCLESALLKLKESPIAGDQLRAVRHDNARRLLARSQT